MRFRVLVLAIIGLFQLTIGGSVITTFAQTGQWVNIVENSDLEGDDVSCFFARENAAGDETVLPATIVDGAGVDDSRGIVVKSVDDAPEDWNTELFIRLPQTLPVGTKCRLSFDYKANTETEVSMQCHGEPTKYIFWGFGSATFNTSWQHFNREYIISEEMSKDDIPMRTIAIELAKNRTATTFYFDNSTGAIKSR